LKRNDFEIEICAGNIESVLAADLGRADRVELCENLSEGGTTPSYGSIILSKEKCSLDVFVIIRSRGGDFVYSEIEFEVMRKDVQSAVEIGADGIVIGCLKKDGTVDYEMCSRLIEDAKGLPVTFHRAFDITPDPFEALETIKSLGVDRILTSGQKNRAEDGIRLIRELQENAGVNLRIMPGSGINELNIQNIALSTGVKSFHASLREDIESKTNYTRQYVSENKYKATSASRVRKLIKKVEEL
jgi:copper homeostasis protein